MAFESADWPETDFPCPECDGTTYNYYDEPFYCPFCHIFYEYGAYDKWINQVVGPGQDEDAFQDELLDANTEAREDNYNDETMSDLDDPDLEDQDLED